MNIFETFYYYITHPVEWYYEYFYGENYFQILHTFFIEFWLWIPFTYLMIRYMFLPVWQFSRNIKWGSQVNYVLLAVDVPKKNEQSIQAMELVFEQILGAHSSQNFVERWWVGIYQLSMSCEIVAIDGYIQFLFRVPEPWRELIEGAVYGQYPDAEVVEVEDYTSTVPTAYPNDTHDMWGVEWSFDNKENPFYPFRTYTEFQDSFSQIFVDPLAGLLEAMSKIGKGEQIWFQMVCTPLGADWAKEAQGIIDKIAGRQVAPKKSFLDKAAEIPAGIFNEMMEQIATVRPLPESGDGGDQKNVFDSPMFKMTPGEQDSLKALQRKTSKLAYAVKMRYGYFAEHGTMNKTRGVNAIIGAIKQFNSTGRQGFKPELKKTGTKAAYFRVKQRKAYRQTKLTRALKERSTNIGMPPMKWSTEELATLFHFPGMDVRAPMLKRTELVKAEAPGNLPFEEQGLPEFEEPDIQTQEAGFPEGLPTLDGEGEVEYTVPVSFDYDSDYFEEKFAVDKKAFEESRDEREETLKKIEKEEQSKQEIGTTAQIKNDPDTNFEEKFEQPESEVSEFVERPQKSFEVIDDHDELDFEIVGYHEGVQTSVTKKKKEKEESDTIPENLPFV